LIPSLAQPTNVKATKTPEPNNSTVVNENGLTSEEIIQRNKEKMMKKMAGKPQKPVR
jgi:hypothetical protein